MGPELHLSINKRTIWLSESKILWLLRERGLERESPFSTGPAILQQRYIKVRQSSLTPPANRDYAEEGEGGRFYDKLFFCPTVSFEALRIQVHQFPPSYIPSKR